MHVGGQKILTIRLVDSMYKNNSSFISSYRENNNTHHVMMLRHLEEWKENLDKSNITGRVSIELSKAFYYVPHDLLLEKLAAHGVDERFLCYIYSYLLISKQCLRINNINSDCLNIISGVSQGYIVGDNI